MRDGAESILAGARLRVAAALSGAALIAAAVSLLLAPPPAGAALIGNGTADWGVKSTWRNYILLVPPAGTIGVSDGAEQNEDGTFKFGSATGEINEDGSGEISFGGTVEFLKPAHGIDVTMANPRITFDGDQGTLFVDATRTGDGGGDYPNLAYVDLDLSGATETVNGRDVTIGPIATTMTAEGVPLLGSYDEGEPMDPVTFTVRTKKPKTGSIAAGDRRAKITAKNRQALLATVRCGTEDCAVKTRKKITAKAKGKGRKAKRIKAKIAAPRRVDAGQKAAVKIKVSRRDARKLRGRKATLTAKINVTGAVQPVTKKLKIKVRGK